MLPLARYVPAIWQDCRAETAVVESVREVAD
jgi:hypothetical protein